MNKYNLKEFLQSELADHASSFKETSYDNENGEYLCKDTATPDVYDFDRYIEKQFHGQQLPASPDAIHLGKKQLYFVEFKNQRLSNIDNAGIGRKFTRGTEILQGMLSDFTPRDWQRTFCVVFKKDSRPVFFDSRHFEKSKVRFNLDGLNSELGNFYDKILTEDINFYSEQFRQLKC
ncbi:TPA: hypothetical protein ACKRMY_006009 [Pseudomonas aeruginosa]